MLLNTQSPTLGKLLSWGFGKRGWQVASKSHVGLLFK